LPNTNIGEAATRNNTSAWLRHVESVMDDTQNHQRVSIGGQVQVPAAAVIPAPIAYINVVAVKKLVVGFRGRVAGGLAPQLCSVCLPASLCSPSPPTARKRSPAEVLLTESRGASAHNVRLRAVRGRYCEQNSVFKASGLPAFE